MFAFRSRAASGAVLSLVAAWGAAAGLGAASLDRHREVLAAGMVATDAVVRKVRAASGGTVEAILVADGTAIAAGDVVARLNDSLPRADLAAIDDSMAALRARAASMRAERDGLQHIVFPQSLLTPERRALLDGEREALALRQVAEQRQKDLLRQRIACFEDEIRAYLAQAQSKAGEASLIDEQLRTARGLREKGLVPVTRLTDLEREAFRLSGEEHGWLAANIAVAKAKIAEAELQLLQIDRERRRDAAKDIDDIDAKLADLNKRQLGAMDALKNTIVRAPLAGVVQQASLRRPGDTLGAGEEILQIAAKPDSTTVEAKISPADVDALAIGQPAALRIPSRPPSSARVSGTIQHIGADAADPRYFTVRVVVASDQLAGHGMPLPMAGMPVELVLRRAACGAVSCLVKPLRQRIVRAFRALGAAV